jgi:hypothetical protein
MLRKAVNLTLIGLAAAIFSLSAWAVKPGDGQNGNGSPKGSADYGLEIIAFDNCPGGDFKNTNRRQMAVQADLGSGVCDDDPTKGCDSNSDCGGASCLGFGVCAHDGSTSCNDDFDCATVDCEGDGFCAGSNDQEACFHDQDCLDFSAGEFCTAGPIPIGTKISDLTRVNTILLTDAGDGDFNVVDGNACDNDGGELALPTEAGLCDDDSGSPTYQRCIAGFDTGEACSTQKRRGYGDDTALSGGCRDGVAYSVWLRLVGPSGKIAVTLCAVDPDSTDPADVVNPDDVVVCSSNHLIRSRSGGNSVFTDATVELLSLCFDDACTKNNSVALFDPDLANFFWKWNTEGKPHAQLRFYHLSNFL